jgi:hypothetical protein
VCVCGWAYWGGGHVCEEAGGKGAYSGIGPCKRVARGPTRRGFSTHYAGMRDRHTSRAKARAAVACFSFTLQTFPETCQLHKGVGDLADYSV